MYVENCISMLSFPKEALVLCNEREGEGGREGGKEREREREERERRERRETMRGYIEKKCSSYDRNSVYSY